jgi:hypothetical protein
MPWMPEVFTAAAVARQPEGRPGDDVVGYYEGLLSEDRSALERSFAGEPRANDPRVGHVEGTREFRAFVSGRWTGCASVTPRQRTWPSRALQPAR